MTKAKHIIALLAGCFALLSCGLPKDRVRIEGKFNHISQAEFYVYSEDGAIDGMDTVRIEDGEFTYERQLADTAILTLLYPNFSEMYVVAAPGATIKMEGDAGRLGEMAISGTPDNEALTNFRLQQLHEAVAADPAGRVAEVRPLLDEFERRAFDMCRAERLHREGKLPKRICHCDTKVNNMMFDEQGRVLCVVDLDTVMPSYIFSDFGDFMRTAANTGEEDDRNLDRVNFDMEIFKAFTKGYLETARVFLTDVETDNLPYAATLFPYMQAVRFLTDYINGDTYYKINYPEHNLVRTRAQFKLLQSAEAAGPAMKAYIDECLGR